MEYSGQRITIMGLGRFGGGVAVARWMAERGAVLTVTDSAGADSLVESLAAIESLPLAALHLDGHREDDFRWADIVVVNPAVRPTHPMLEVARESGARLTSEVECFLRACPARVIGVTGSNGKSTTSAMLAAILREAGRRVWLGGNIGHSLLGDLKQMGPDDRVVMELSSAQLHYLSVDTPMPRGAVVTNFSPNHLDWHGDLASYQTAKQRLLTLQSSEGWAVLGVSLNQDPSWRDAVREEPVEPVADGDLPELIVPGRHNRQNAVLAATAAVAEGASMEAIRGALASFRGLPGRLERIAELAGRVVLNDTTSTTPASTAAALEAVDRPVWLLAGGNDKGLDLAVLASAAGSARGVGLFGVTARRIAQEITIQSPNCAVAVRETLGDALLWCWERSNPGDVILLSPGCASTDQFQSFVQRGAVFKSLIDELKSRG